MTSALRQRISAIAWALCVAAHASGGVEAQSSDDQLAQWIRKPEDPGMRDPCLPSLRSASALADLKAHGASSVEMMRWAEREAERLSAKWPNDPSIPVGMNEVLLHLIRRSQFDQPIYEKIPGGFPQWVFRSCLKGRPLD